MRILNLHEQLIAILLKFVFALYYLDGLLINLYPVDLWALCVCVCVLARARNPSLSCYCLLPDLSNDFLASTGTITNASLDVSANSVYTTNATKPVVQQISQSHTTSFQLNIQECKTQRETGKLRSAKGQDELFQTWNKHTWLIQSNHKIFKCILSICTFSKWVRSGNRSQ